MLILKTTDKSHSPGLCEILSDIQKLACHVSCYCEDMAYVPERSDLLRLPKSLLPDPAQRLHKLLHDNVIMVRACAQYILPDNRSYKLTRIKKKSVLSRWAKDRGIVMNLENRFSGPQIIWLQSGGVFNKKDRLSFFVLLQRPIRHTEATANRAREEPPSECIIERPIADNRFVESSLQLQVGDIIVLEGEERLRTRDQGEIDHCDLCMISTLHSTSDQMEEKGQE